VTIARRLLPGACVTEELRNIPNLSGMKFEIIYTNCDTLAKEEEVSVYVSRSLVNGNSFLARWSNRRARVFTYDPGGPGVPPSITVPEKDKIVISIPEVSSILFQRKQWRNMSIDYEIGHVIYPAKTAAKSAK